MVSGVTARYRLGQEVQKRHWGNGVLGMIDPESPVLRRGGWMPPSLCGAQILLYEGMYQPHASLASGSSAAKWRHGHLLVNDKDALGRGCGPGPRPGQAALRSHLACH